MTGYTIIPTVSPALVRIARNEAVRELAAEFGAVVLIFGGGYAVAGLLDVIKTVILLFQ